MIKLNVILKHYLKVSYLFVSSNIVFDE